jgi:hypothetical protein
VGVDDGLLGDLNLRKLLAFCSKTGGNVRNYSTYVSWLLTLMKAL